MIRFAIIITLCLTGCGALDDATARLAEAAEPDDDQGDEWCAALELALESCDGDHYVDDALNRSVMVGCTDVALAATGFDVEADPGGRTALHGALLEAFGLYPAGTLDDIIAACTE